MLLYRLLEPKPEWIFNAILHGWVHPVVKELTLTSNPQGLRINLSADYRLHLTPRSEIGEALSVDWLTPLPEVVAGKRITDLTFTVEDNTPTLRIQLDRHRLNVVVSAGLVNPSAPVYWEVTESHAGLWYAFSSRTEENNYVHALSTD